MSDVDSAARVRLDYVEAQLKQLVPGYVPYTEKMSQGLPAEVVDLARAGKKIAAIKAYRDATGADLNEAKNVIDSL